MAYDKPLKIQWTEIDGRTVPLVLPQYWSDEQDDWVVSSEQNRLPVDAQLTGSNVSQNFLEGTTLTPGSVVIVPDRDYPGTRAGIGIRWDSPARFTVKITPKAANKTSAVEPNTTLIDQSDSEAIGRSEKYQLVHRRNGLIVSNEGTQEATILFLTITDFYS